MSSPMTQTGIMLRHDPSRVITRLFVPGREDVGPGESRASVVIDRILNHLTEEAVEAEMRSLDKRFGHRHTALHDTFRRHAELIRPLREVDEQLGSVQPASTAMSEARQVLGASFTHEYAIEGAALCNPLIVLHPQQPGNGDVRFIMTTRNIGEGHRSSIGFRSGTLLPSGTVTIDDPAPFPATGSPGAAPNYRSVFEARLSDVIDRELAAFVIQGLPPTFANAELDARLEALAPDVATRHLAPATIAYLRSIALSSYLVSFPPDTDVSQRVLWPQSPAESHGMEDARFVRFTADDGTVTYYATYTAFDGTHIGQHLLETPDFECFTASPVAGEAAIGKGLALFPRKVGGRFVALSRYDRETNAIAYSDDLRRWNAPETIQVPDKTWEILQLGNCGSPIETERGWLVITHGVGPMRTYSLGALLLDLDEPHRVLARSAEPLISPEDGSRDGYVPNVVYSCGSFAHNDVLVMPYGIGDQGISIATASITELLDSLEPEP